MQKSAVHMFVISTIGRNLFFGFLRSLVAPLCQDDIFAVFVISNRREKSQRCFNSYSSVAYNDYCLNLSCRICIFSIIWLKVGLLVP